MNARRRMAANGASELLPATRHAAFQEVLLQTLAIVDDVLRRLFILIPPSDAVAAAAQGGALDVMEALRKQYCAEHFWFEVDPRGVAAIRDGVGAPLDSLATLQEVVRSFCDMVTSFVAIERFHYALARPCDERTLKGFMFPEDTPPPFIAPLEELWAFQREVWQLDETE